MSETRHSLRRCLPRVVTTGRMAVWRWVAASAGGLGEISFGLLLSAVVAGLMFGACGAPDEVMRHASPAQTGGSAGGDSSSSSAAGGTAGSTAQPERGRFWRRGRHGRQVQHRWDRRQRRHDRDRRQEHNRRDHRHGWQGRRRRRRGWHCRRRRHQSLPDWREQQGRRRRHHHRVIRRGRR